MIFSLVITAILPFNKTCFCSLLQGLDRFITINSSISSHDELSGKTEKKKISFLRWALFSALSLHFRMWWVCSGLLGAKALLVIFSLWSFAGWTSLADWENRGRGSERGGVCSPFLFFLVLSTAASLSFGERSNRTAQYRVARQRLVINVCCFCFCFFVKRAFCFAFGASGTGTVLP